MTIVEVDINLDDAVVEVVENAQAELEEVTEREAALAVEAAVDNACIDDSIDTSISDAVDRVDVSEIVEDATTKALTDVDWEGEILSSLWSSMYGKIVARFEENFLDMTKLTEDLTKRVEKLERAKKKATCAKVLAG